MAKFGFDSSEVDLNDMPSGSYEPIPPGDYVLSATEAVEKTTKSGGEMIAVTFEVVKGEFEGRKIWNNFNTRNASEVAQRIGRQQLVFWATACGKPDCDDTDKLIDKPFKASVGIDKGTGGYADSNVVKSFLFEADEKPAAAKPAAAKPAAPPPAAKSGGKPTNPWD